MVIDSGTDSDLQPARVSKRISSCASQGFGGILGLAILVSMIVWIIVIHHHAALADVQPLPTAELAAFRVIEASHFKQGSALLQHRPAAGLKLVPFSDNFLRLFSVDQSTLAKAMPLATRNYAFAHEGSVYVPSTNEVFFVSNRLQSGSKQTVRMYALSLNGSNSIREITSDVHMANGATIDCTTGDVLVASQGMGSWDLTASFVPSAIYRLNIGRGDAGLLVNNVGGLPFNSINDLVKGRDGTLWFTDPEYGRQQGFRAPKKILPNAVWALSPSDPYPRLVAASGISRPNGIALSLDEQTLYVTDSGFALGDGISRHVTAFKIVGKDSGAPALGERRIMYYADDGIADGVKLDSEGNLYVGQGDGVAVVSPSGSLLGKILMPRNVSGVTNLVFGGRDYRSLFLLSETSVWVVDMTLPGALRCPNQ